MKEMHYFGIACAAVIFAGSALFYVAVLQPMFG